MTSNDGDSLPVGFHNPNTNPVIKTEYDSDEYEDHDGAMTVTGLVYDAETDVVSQEKGEVHVKTEIICDGNALTTEESYSQLLKCRLCSKALTLGGSCHKDNKFGTEGQLFLCNVCCKSREGPDLPKPISVEHIRQIDEINSTSPSKGILSPPMDSKVELSQSRRNFCDGLPFCESCLTYFSCVKHLETHMMSKHPGCARLNGCNVFTEAIPKPGSLLARTGGSSDDTTDVRDGILDVRLQSALVGECDQRGHGSGPFAGGMAASESVDRDAELHPNVHIKCEKETFADEWDENGWIMDVDSESNSRGCCPRGNDGSKCKECGFKTETFSKVAGKKEREASDAEDTVECFVGKHRACTGENIGSNIYRHSQARAKERCKTEPKFKQFELSGKIVELGPAPAASRGTRPRKYYSRRGTFICETCERCFSQKTSLDRHQIVHTGEKSYLCEVCSKAFGLLESLKSHMKIHTGEKSHKCTECGMYFRHYSHLRRHTLGTHRGVKPFSCQHCDKSFKRSEHLKRHTYTHTDKESPDALPYQCRVCPKRFHMSARLKAHTKVHTGQHMCGVCDKAYTSSSALKYHEDHTHT